MSHPIDEQLQRWNAEQVEEESRLAEIRSRIMEALPAVMAESKAAGTEPVKRTGGHPTLLVRFGYAALGAAACLIFMLAVSRFAAPPVPKATGSMASVREMVALPEARVAAGCRLFKELESLFNGDLQWVAESNGEIAMGVGESPETAGGDPVLVRLTVMQRVSESADWTSAWQSDVVVRGQEAVDIVPHGEGASRLTLWVYPMNDGKIAVDTALALTAPATFRVNETIVAKPMVPVQVGEGTENGIEYRLYQTVVPLAACGAGCPVVPTEGV
jgi:hypothetical protein